MGSAVGTQAKGARPQHLKVTTPLSPFVETSPMNVTPDPPRFPCAALAHSGRVSVGEYLDVYALSPSRSSG